MKYFYIIIDLSREYVEDTQVPIKTYLGAKGAVCGLNSTSLRDRESTHTNSEMILESTEYVITIGGDGTLIQAARDLTGRGIPTVGTSCDRLGYLNQISRQENTAPAMDTLLEDHYQLEKRVMVQETVFHDKEPVLPDITLNEIAVTRQDPLRVLRYSAYVDDEYLNEYAAGGVLMATPTDSTTYSLSVGSSAIVPSVWVMVLTPACSHSFNVRSIVLAPEGRIEIRLLNGGQVVSFDGDSFMEPSAGDNTCIECSHLGMAMMKLKQVSFMQDLSNHSGRI